MNSFDSAAKYGVMPVICVPGVEYAVDLADALSEGGIPQIEITMRNDAALDSIRAIKRERPNMLVGAGTILSIEQCDMAKEAGADFVVSPGFNPKVVKHCVDNGWDILPGCVTPSEIETGLSFGLDTFKFFPSENLGGLETIKQLCGPYANIKFVPTSGITMDNMLKYLSCEKIAAVGGSFMAPSQLIKERNFSAITALCKKAVVNSLGFTLAHIGVNGADAKEAVSMAQRLAFLFGLDTKDGSKSVFSGTLVEFCKGGFPGKMGHIGIGTISVPRAIYYLQSKGVKFRDDFRHFDKSGNLDAAYLDEEVGGFAVHIVRKV